MLRYADEPVAVQVWVDRADRNLIEPTRVHRVVPSATTTAGSLLVGLLGLLIRLLGLLVGLLGLLIRLLGLLIRLLRRLVGLLGLLIRLLRRLVTRLLRLLIRWLLRIRWRRHRGGSRRSRGLQVRCETNTHRTNDGIADLGVTLLDDHHICNIESTTLNTTNQTHLSRTLRLAKMRTTVFLRISPL